MADKPHDELRMAFRELLNGHECHIAASVFDPISVRMASDLGYKVCILGGSVASLQVLGAPDLSLITLDEFSEQASRIGRASQIPVIADADHGYGNALNVMRTVTELQKAGVAALTLEDTLLPKPYGSQMTTLIDREEAAAKIYAARVARTDDFLSIIARTDAAATTVEDSVLRTTAYQAAGADAICMVGVKDFQHLEALTGHLSLPLILISYGNPALNDLSRLSEANVRVVINGHKPYLATIKAAFDALCMELGKESKDLSVQQLLSKYTLSDSYSEWVRTYLKTDSRHT